MNDNEKPEIDRTESEVDVEPFVRRFWIFNRTDHIPGQYIPDKYEWKFEGTEAEARKKLNELIDGTFSPFTTFGFMSA